MDELAKVGFTLQVIGKLLELGTRKLDEKIPTQLLISKTTTLLLSSNINMMNAHNFCTFLNCKLNANKIHGIAHI